MFAIAVPVVGDCCTFAVVNSALVGFVLPITVLFSVPALAIKFVELTVPGVVAPIFMLSIVPPAAGFTNSVPADPVGAILISAFTPLNVTLSNAVNLCALTSMLLIVPPFDGLITTVPDDPVGDNVITAFSPWAVMLPVVNILEKLPTPVIVGSIIVNIPKGLLSASP